MGDSEAAASWGSPPPACIGQDSAGLAGGSAKALFPPAVAHCLQTSGWALVSPAVS